MKAIMVMFDSLNRRFLKPYGSTLDQPGFARLAQQSVVFDNCYAGSLPCMPARRELHTGRYNFLHRCWGPVEPFDDSMPQILKDHGVYTHLVSDHAHYWEDGGCTYHTRYSSWEASRGQEGDSWKGSVADPQIPQDAVGRMKHSWRQDWVNREYIKKTTDMPMHHTCSAGLEFIEKNHASNSWFLQIETFDPHEPFYIPRDPDDPQGLKLDPDYHGPHFDWPEYGKASTYSEDKVKHLRALYTALIARCDHYMGKVLEMMDTYNLWEDTMLIVCTDHGFLLGEHGWLGKNRMPTYDEIAHTPFFLYDPRAKESAGTRDDSLVQTIDIAPTLLEFFGVEVPASMQGKPLTSSRPPRGTALFGLHGGHVNITDGRYVYMRAPVSPDDRNLYNYTLLPTHIYSLFTPEELQDMELVDPLPFTKNCKVLKVRALKPSHNTQQHTMGDFLFDLQNDPDQRENIVKQAPEVVSRLQVAMVEAMKANDAPAEAYVRYGLQPTL